MSVSVRYIVDDVEAAVGFYSGQLGFTVEMQPGPGFALLARDELRLLLNATSGPGGASQRMPDGREPEPGGWTGSRSRSATLMARWSGCVLRASRFATRSSAGAVAVRSWSRTPPAIR
jgi:catechol 2,3-dioxygenase-like lactoylglutathione lyase family enzyme